MKTNMLWLVIALAFTACKDKEKTATPAPKGNETFTDVNGFYAKSETPWTTFDFDAGTGGNFTLPNGTQVSIPPNAVMDVSQNLVSGTVTLELVTCNKKSEMLLNRINTLIDGGNAMLTSAGIFALGIKKGSDYLFMATGKSITITQPTLGKPIDTAMKGYLRQLYWEINYYDTVSFTTNAYQYKMAAFPGGTRSFNCIGNTAGLNMYSPTTLNVSPTENAMEYGLQVYLVLKNEVALTPLKSDFPVSNKFTFAQAPQGANAWVVAIGVKEQRLYYAIKEITITPNLNVSIDLKPTTNDELKTKLLVLDN